MALSPALLLAAVQNEKNKRLCEISLYDFVKSSWDIVEPGTPFVDGWHIRVVCDHLQAAIEGKIRNLIINMPPRHCKSLLIAVFFPMWVWVTRPEYRWLFASYSGNLSMRDSLKCRRLVQSAWYQERWGSTVKLISDQNVKQFFETDRFGYRFATSVGGTTTGMGGNAIVIDDPHSAMEAQSDTIREGVLEWFDQAMSTRLNDPKTGIRIIVMQRLHARDLSGHLLAQGGWEHLVLPAEFDGVRRKTSLGEYDPRTKQGELLWPELYDAKALAPIKAALGTYGTAGQLQQRPAPAGGGIIKVAEVKLWPAEKQLPPLSYLVQSYDTAFSEKTQNDPSACTVWGITQYNKRTIAILMDAWTEHLAYPDLRARMIDDWNDLYGGDPDDVQNRPKKSDLMLIEAKASGQSLLQDLRQANLPVRGYNPGKADKITRAHSIAPLVESGCIYVMESKKRPGKPVSWAKMVLDQLEVFPAGEHDDIVDTVTQALIYLRDTGFLELDVAEEEVDDEEDYSHKRGNPYAA